MPDSVYSSQDSAEATGSAASLTRRASLLQLLVMPALPALLGATPVQAAQSSEPLLAAGPADVMADFQRFLNQRDPLSISDFGGPYSRRDVAEVLLLHQALQAGAWTSSLRFLDMPSGERLLREIGSGHAICSATCYWSEDIAGAEADLTLSLPVLGQGEFEVGLYALPSNRQALAAKTLDDVRRLRVLSNRNWVVDWRTLDRLGLEQRQHVTNWELMPKMLAAGRADFLLAPFQASPDLSLQVGQVKLIPIPGIKIAMQGTRHYLISRNHPEGAQLKARLDAGLQVLRQQGRIRKAYTQSGFFNPAVSQWLRF
ncbi:hypothetical protein WG899_10280 [Paucibacter sp. AS339]|uniref:hypothetical protein n=1 Tax=Paucibacter hankyongi TaxID=3133434 RepID=UPI0030A44F2A